MNIKIPSFIALVWMAVSCNTNPGPGVSFDLAQNRKANIENIDYDISFNIPEQIDSAIYAFETISVELSKCRALVIDFKENGENLHKISVNGEKINAGIIDGHIIIPACRARRGLNEIKIEFTAGELSLNRRNQFLYTLLVPDRASTLFPCFDQPDLKGNFKLTLEIPDRWIAVTNTDIEGETQLENGRKRISFNRTEPLSTYLFSFVCGDFQRVCATKGSRSISIYHRETDPAKAAQCQGILGSIFNAIDYMEEYTQLPYPFAKYDCVAIPDFQYGGMEHTGATLYNDRSLFLDPGPTTSELQNRESLIAHETAHMWFGDCVTMKWFNDVWTKEVFANWFAARIVRPSFPEINFKVSDLYNYYTSAYSEDRTPGSNAIQRPLDNLNNAGLIYCNIIYDKAPVVLEKLNQKMGEDAMREGIREYIHKFKYGNADWDDLIAVLEAKADFDVKEWSRVWIKEKGMPEYDAEGNCIDPFGNGNVWQQEVGYKDAGDGLRLPNPDGSSYGCFRLDERTSEYIYRHYTEFDETERMSFSVNLFENVWRGYISAVKFQKWLCKAIFEENNPLIYGNMLDYGCSVSAMYAECNQILEAALVSLVNTPGQDVEKKLLSFRALAKTAQTEEGLALLYDAWKNGELPCGYVLGESDCTSVSYQLALRLPQNCIFIHDIQSGRITNPDRLESFEYIFQAVSPDRSVRDSLFNSFRHKEGRRPESRVLTALSLLCDPIRGKEAEDRILPALELLPEVQKYGDIFFPATWCRRVLSAQNNYEAYLQVKEYLDNNPKLNPLLVTKVRQAAGWILSHYGNQYGIIPEPIETININGSITIDPKDIEFKEDTTLRAESYILDINNSGVTVRSNGRQGRIHAVQSLRQLIPGTGIYGSFDEKITLPMCHIYDSPRYSYRSFMLDCCRHFISVPEIKRVLDVMCFYKLNKFHWHLTDDQAWRIHIDKYPELTQGQAHYTKEDIRRLVSYAAERGIDIVPEFELPGHFMAALAAKPELGCTGGPYEIPDEWGVFNDVMCPGKESSFRFIEDVINEMTELFPYEYFHIGGDECPKIRWIDCPECQTRISELNLVGEGGRTKEDKLQNYVTMRVKKYLESKKRKVIGWEEILDADINDDAIIMSWSGTDAGIRAAANGNSVIMAPAAFCYFDHCQVNTDISDPDDARLEPEPREYFLPLEWCHEYEPEDGFADGTESRIIGVEACLWSEYVEDARKLEYMMLPRLAAESEVQWCAKSSRDYQRFLDALTNNHFPRYDLQDYMYCRVCQGINGYWK